jgi:hypothetical protein
MRAMLGNNVVVFARAILASAIKEEQIRIVLARKASLYSYLVRLGIV